MLDFNCGVKGVPTINLTKDEVKVCYQPLQGNIAEDLEEDLEMLAPAPGPSTHQPAIHDVSSKAPIPPADEERFSPQPLERLEALMSKENRTLTLLKVGTEEASTCFNVLASQDEASYEVILDEVDDALAESSGPAKAVSAVAREVQKTMDKSDGSQTSKSVGKNIFFHTDVTLADGSNLLGDEWPGVFWYPDMPEAGAALRDLSWFIEIC